VLSYLSYPPTRNNRGILKHVQSLPPRHQLGDYVTDKFTSAVGFSRAHNIYVNLSVEMTFLSAEGKVLCKKSPKNGVDYAISEDGQWLALSQFSSVDLWRMEDLLGTCKGQQ
jgi:hypothetical protein